MAFHRHTFTDFGSENIFEYCQICARVPTVHMVDVPATTECVLCGQELEAGPQITRGTDGTPMHRTCRFGD